MLGQEPTLLPKIYTIKMKTYIAFLRGINVGGHKKIPMQKLRDILNAEGFNDVKTYIQTGNIVFKSSESNEEALKSSIKNTILKEFGFEVPTLIKRPKVLESILDDCPFNEEEKVKSYFALLYNKPNKEQVKSIEAVNFPNEKVILKQDCIYLYSSIGYGKSKANNNFFEKQLKITATTRNYKTLIKVLKLSSDL